MSHMTARFRWWWRRWSPASMFRRARYWLSGSQVTETISMVTPSGEARVVIPAGKHGAWEVYVRDELVTRGSSASVLPQCLVDASAPSARERGCIVAADELHNLGMALLEEQAA